EWTWGSGLSATGATPTVTLPVGTTIITLTVTDNDGLQDTDMVSVTVVSPSGDKAILRINSGDGATMAFGEIFDEDKYFVGDDKMARNPNLTDITGTMDDLLFLSERTTNSNDATFGYAIPVPNGKYRVRFHFAEIWIGIVTPGEVGKRVFDVLAEGNVVIDDLDIFKEVGTAAPYSVDVMFDVQDEMMDLEFVSSRNRPKVSGFEVFAVDTEPSPPIADAGNDINRSANEDGIASITLDGSNSIDLDGTIVSYIWEENGSFVASGASPTLNLPVGTYTFDLTVTDDDGLTDTDAVVVEVDELPPFISVMRLNSGGDETEAFGVAFMEDQYFSEETKPFINTNLTDFPGDDDDLYLYERTTTTSDATIDYNIPVANGTYLVRLHFAETWFGVTKPGGVGKRVFSVMAEEMDVPEWSDIDIIAQTGVLAPLVLEAEVTVMDNSLDLLFDASTNRPKVNAIEVLGLSTMAPSVASDDDLEVQTEGFTFMLSPNPADQYIRMHLSGSIESGERVSVRILGLSGRVITEQMFEAGDFDGTQLDVSRLNSGTYILQLFKGDVQINRKFIKN
ncbi:MAG: malectin domain-containing carbohydrate-binding protein, partial [Cyclobacteriaceae bacterium]